MSKRLPVVWDADPHTIAKIEILKAYLNAWFRILGMKRPGEIILYVDGFAGPGYYRNHDEGSPLAAIRVAEKTIEDLGDKFVAKQLHCAFIESKRDRFKVLSDTVEPFVGKAGLGITLSSYTVLRTFGKNYPDHFEVKDRYLFSLIRSEARGFRLEHSQSVWRGILPNC
jgi:three-Cys-motif partner protein